MGGGGDPKGGTIDWTIFFKTASKRKKSKLDREEEAGVESVPCAPLMSSEFGKMRFQGSPSQITWVREKFAPFSRGSQINS